ncbi:hypothetical protein B0T19DRAFT_133535 [Cercophora scortea]|uniref:WSC domain-containing protein n=1 Tax=Cercophora scortea TaxID=314031 RepID=A0AAE0MIP7_9PEZI|nr:hypothetical protein B0T19DRAFT_133535 [Cercophora scortea]
MLLTTIFATLVGTVAAKDSRTFAVLHHYGKGPLTTCRADPVVSPGVPSAHLHTVMGASNFGLNATGESLRQSRCTTAKPKADLSAYWFPTLFFKDPKDGHFEQVKLFYMNVYYFFEATNDKIQAFPVGLQMVSGNAMLRTAPSTTGNQNLDPSKGPVQPAQITCPRGNFNPPSWPVGSDGSMAGIGDSNNKGSGIGFPFQDCDGYASPMRADLHFPSCYNPAAGLTNYKTNMAWPTDAGNGKHDCPKGWIHTPHIFYEVYWDTHALLPRFKDLIGKESPFVFANGDVTGYSNHGDFIAGWDEKALQQIIDNCDAGDAGMDKCPGLIGGLNDDSTSCNIECPVVETTSGNLDKLPGNNPLAGWKYGTASTAPKPVDVPAAQVPAAAPSTSSTSSTKAATTSKTAPSPSTTLVPVVKAASSSVAAPVMPKPTTSAAAQMPAPKPPVAKSSSKTTTVVNTVTLWKTTTVYGGGATATAPAAAPSATNAVAGFKYAGCFKDGQARVLDGEIRPNLGKISNTACVTYCSSKGFSIAGTEYGGQCYCGSKLKSSEKLAESACNMTCEGAAGEKCGGGWALSVYAKDTTALTKRHAHNHLDHHRRGPSARRR